MGSNKVNITKGLLSFGQKKIFWSITAGIFSLSSFSLYNTFNALKTNPDTAKKNQKTTSSRLSIDGYQWNRKDERTILDRNIFNSEGTLGDGFDELSTSQQLPTGDLIKSDLPLKLVGVIFAGDPKHGLALVEDTQKRTVLSYLVGDVVRDGAKLIEIYEDRIVFLRGDQREYIEKEVFQLARPRRKAKSGGLKGGSSELVAGGAVSDSYREEGFERDGSQILISEEFKRSLLQPDSMTKVLQDAKAEPNIVGGEIKGFRLTRIRDNSIYLKAGFQDGDVVEEINGIPLRDAAGAIRLLQQLRSANNIEAKVKRGGNAFNMMINIQ